MSGGIKRISLIFYNMKVCCVFSSESPNLQPRDFFLGTQERVRNSRGKRVVSVRAIEVLLYMQYMRLRCIGLPISFLSSPLAGKRDIVVKIFVRCMCVRPVWICRDHNLYSNAYISKQFGTVVALEEEKCHLKHFF